MDRTERRSSMTPAVFRVLLESGTLPISREVAATGSFCKTKECTFAPRFSS